MDVVDYRVAAISDIGIVKQLELTCFGEIWENEKAYQYVLLQGLSLIATKNEIPIGYVLVMIDNEHSAETDGGILVKHSICSLGVLEEHRNKGIGQTLLSMVAYDSCKLNVRPSNLAALHIYKKHGFDIIGETASYYPDGESCYVMVLCA